MIKDSVVDRDIEVLQCQLERDFVNPADILERCVWGFPRLILLNPLIRDRETKDLHVDFQALSNLIWLTCPYLNTEIHEIESHGYIDRIEDFIQSDRELETRMKNAHAHYYHLRKSLFRNYMGNISSLELNDIFNSGIGGITEIDHIKCLHIHYAHYRLCDDNVAGLITEHLLEGKLNCRRGRCRECLKGIKA